MNATRPEEKGPEKGDGTAKLAEFISGTRYESIPSGVVKTARDALIDWLGVTLAGSQEPGAGIMAGYARKLQCAGEASVIGHGFRTSAELAALANGTSGHALDFDDTNSTRGRYNLHPSTAIYPAALAVAESRRLSGKEALVSYITGMEAMFAGGAAIGQSLPASGWHPTPVLGTIGAAAAAARAMGLNTGQTQSTLGIAASLAGGLMRNFGTMVKPMHAGNAARNGVLAACLAADGFTGNTEVMDGDWGFCQMFSGGKFTSLGKAVEGPWDWRMASLGLGFKAYPSCRSTHSGIDAALFLKEQYHPNPEEIAGITVNITRLNTEIARFHRPETGYQGKFSIPYCVAAALLNGRVVLADFTDEAIKDPRKTDLVTKVGFEFPEGLDGALNLATEVTVVLKSGMKHSHRVAIPKGEPENPMTDAEQEAKFRDCCSRIMDERAADRILDFARGFETAADTGELFTLLG
ncbi:MAG: MmgE/PrpD family protein [Chloroflexota bacterium]